MSKISDKRPGDHFTTIDHNRLAQNSNRQENFSVVQGSGLVLKKTPSGPLLDLVGQFNLTPALCTAKATPSAGLHTFSECDMTRTIVDGGKVFTSCWCAGDFNNDWDLSIAGGSETYAFVFSFGGQNMAFIFGSYYSS